MLCTIFILMGSERRNGRNHTLLKGSSTREKRKPFSCRLPRFADFHIIFESFFAVFSVPLHRRMIVYKHFPSFLFASFFNFSIFLLIFSFLIIVVSLFTSMLYNMLSNLIIFPSRFSSLLITTIGGRKLKARCDAGDFKLSAHHDN